MDPLTLLRELYGEETIRRIVASGFDSVDKIAAATPDSLSFFAGINEALAGQIVGSAADVFAAPAAAGYRHALSGTTESPVKPRVHTPGPPAARSGEPRGRTRTEPLDERPILDAGGIAKTLALGTRAKEVMEEDLLDQIGLTDAEATFLEGASPWSPPPRAVEPAVEAPAPPRPEELEIAPVSDWSPEKDPDPVPRLVRAVELEGDSPPEPPVEPAELEPAEPVSRPSFWKFGR